MKLQEHFRSSRSVSRWLAFGGVLLLLASVGMAQRPDFDEGTETIQVWNHGFQKPRVLWAAEYMLDTFGVNTAGVAYRMGPIRRLETNDTTSWKKQKSRAGYDRYLVWTGYEPDLASEMSKGFFENRDRKHIGDIGKVYITDRKTAGDYDGMTAISYNAGDWWQELWDKLTPEGSTVTIDNHSTNRWYAGEYQKKPFGKLTLIKAIGWVEAGSKKGFTRSKMGTGYTERHVRWIDTTSLPAEISHDQFQTLRGRQDVGFPINIAHIDVGSDGFTKGFTTTEWELKLIADRLLCRAFAGLATAFESVALPIEAQAVLDSVMGLMSPIEQKIASTFGLNSVAAAAANEINGKFDSTKLDAIQALVDKLDTTGAAFDSAFSADNFCGSKDVPSPGGVDDVLRALGQAPLPASMEVGAFISYGKSSTFKYKNFNFEVSQGKAIRAADLRTLNLNPVVTRFLKISGGVSTTSGFGGNKSKTFLYYPAGTVTSLFNDGGVSIGMTGAPSPLNKIGVNLLFTPAVTMEGFGFSANKTPASTLSGTFLASFSIRLKDKD